jgi:NADH:ubiquinone reductase (H+-translocating)
MATSGRDKRIAAREARGGTLVLGGGFAGAYVARLLGREGSTIVSRGNFMLYTPILPEAASGTLDRATSSSRSA